MVNHRSTERPQLSEQQEEQLKSWLRRRKTAQSLALRARIILACAAGESDTAVADELGSTREAVGKWRQRFVKSGCQGLLDEPRPGTPRKIGDEDVERVVVATLESLPLRIPMNSPFLTRVLATMASVIPPGRAGPKPFQVLRFQSFT